MLKKVNVDEAVGMVLCHDITQIVPGVKKGPLFRKGHVVTEMDIPQLLKIGKEHLYIWEMKEGWIHEDEAALRLAQGAVGYCSDFELTAPKEGKVTIKAKGDGLLKIDRERLAALNCLEDVMMATVHGNRSIRKGEVVAGTRIIPLLIEEEKLKMAEAICSEGPLMRVLPYKIRKAGVIVTGSEVSKGRIKDSFGPVVQKKLESFGVEVCFYKSVGDEVADITKAITTAFATGAELVTVTGGMSVDPDDVTPSAIRATGARVITRGVPVLPGAMFMLAYLDGKPVMGLPGCVMYSGVTIFDLVLPGLLAGEKIGAKDLARLGYGGMCLNCPQCVYPNCGFGKGI